MILPTSFFNRPTLQISEKLHGPAKLTKALDIDKKFNGLTADKKTDLWIEDRGTIIQRENIQTGPRINVDYAKEWKDKPYRFFLNPQYYAKKTLVQK